MSTQPEAPQSADYLELAFDHTPGLKKAAAELRRMYAVSEATEKVCRERFDRITELEALNQELLEALQNAKAAAGNPEMVYRITSAAIRARGEMK